MECWCRLCVDIRIVPVRCHPEHFTPKPLYFRVQQDTGRAVQCVHCYDLVTLAQPNLRQFAIWQLYLEWAANCTVCTPPSAVFVNIPASLRRAQTETSTSYSEKLYLFFVRHILSCSKCLLVTEPSVMDLSVMTLRMPLYFLRPCPVQKGQIKAESSCQVHCDQVVTISIMFRKNRIMTISLLHWQIFVKSRIMKYFRMTSS